MSAASKPPSAAAWWMSVTLFAPIASAAEPASSADEAGAVQTIIVTAQRREQGVSDVGAAVSVLDGSDIATLQLAQPKDIAGFTPGLSAVNATSGGTPIFAIRGIGLDDFSSNNTSGVAIYVDDVLAAYPVFLNGPLFDIERVEVLKGPQGTLYGKNSTGGAINFISRRPKAQHESDVSASVGRWNAVSLAGAWSGPVADGLNGRLAFDTARASGWQRDDATGKRYGAQERLAMRGQLRLLVGQDSDLLLNLRLSRDDGAPESPLNGVPGQDPRRVRVGSFNLGRHEHGQGASAVWRTEFAAATFSSITAYDTYRRRTADNYDGLATAVLDDRYDDRYRVASQEFRVASKGHRTTSWVAGLVASHDRVDGEAEGQFADALALPSARATSRYVQTSASWALYAHTETRFAQRFTWVAGARLSTDRRSFQGGTLDIDGTITGTADRSIAHLDESHQERRATGKLGLNVRLDPRTLAYANWSTSYKAGVYYGAPVLSQEGLAYVNPERVSAWELGAKSDPSAGGISWNMAAYVYDYVDRQSLVLLDVDGAILATLGAIPRARIRGAEAELRWRPPGRRLDVRLGLSHTDSEVTRAPATVRGAGLAAPIREGDELAQAPRWSGHLVLRQAWAAGSAHMLTGQVAYRRVARQIAALADPNAGYGPSGTLDLRVELSPATARWTLALSVENVLDRRDSTYAFSALDGSPVYYAQRPRNARLSVTRDF